MKQPVLVIMEVPDNVKLNELGSAVADHLRPRWGVYWAIPLSYTLDVPEGAISA